MNLGLIPLLIVALLLAAAEDVDQVQFLLTGEHRIEHHEGALIVGEAEVAIPSDATVPGPVYVIGGELVIGGTVIGDVTQLAGTVRIESGAIVAGELRHVAGTLEVATDAEIGRLTTIDVAGIGGGGLLPQMTLALLLAAIGYLAARRKPDALANVSAAVSGHPVVTLTVGILVTLTAVAVLVFMAFTLVLIPVTIVGILAGLVTLAYGLIAIGHLIGARLPIRPPAAATALGVVLALIGFRLLGLVPVVGDLLMGGILLTGVGAVLVTYYGVSRFRPDPLPD